tara:strand:- start:25 stop:858 length:834 start_codon:yes stop_codon:yes gene_type:complete
MYGGEGSKTDLPPKSEELLNTYYNFYKQYNEFLYDDNVLDKFFNNIQMYIYNAIKPYLEIKYLKDKDNQELIISYITNYNEYCSDILFYRNIEDIKTYNICSLIQKYGFNEYSSLTNRKLKDKLKNLISKLIEKLNDQPINKSEIQIQIIKLRYHFLNEFNPEHGQTTPYANNIGNSLPELYYEYYIDSFSHHRAHQFDAEELCIFNAIVPYLEIKYLKDNIDQIVTKIKSDSYSYNDIDPQKELIIKFGLTKYKDLNDEQISININNIIKSKIKLL